MNKTKNEVRIIIDEAICKRCGFCIEFCNARVFEADKDGLPLVKNLDDCTNCRLCELRCPDFAVQVEAVDNE